MMNYLKNRLSRSKKNDAPPEFLPEALSEIQRRSQQTRRRGSSFRSLRSSLCATCQELDLGQAPQALAYSTYNPGGIILGNLQDSLASSNCRLCKVLLQTCKETCLAAQRRQDPFRPLLQLRAFHLLPHLLKEWYQEGHPSIENRDFNFFVAVVPTHFSMVPGSGDRALFDDMISKRGLLVFHQDKIPAGGRALTTRVVSAYFDPCIVQNWLRVCFAQHEKCRHLHRPQSQLNLIDCRSRRVLSIDEIDSHPKPEYLALSYVWGNSLDVAEPVLKNSQLPQDLPAVVKDAIDVVLKLGYHYLWVDKYCIDQHDKRKKHEQIMHMDHVYKNAALTIVAAAGRDESYGLPGVSSARPHTQISFDSDGNGYELRSTLPLPHNSIAKSTWASRGWTYQEAILSRRRLVFTDEQLYFECNSTSCVESLDISFDDTKSVLKTGLESSVLPPLFSLHQLSTMVLSGSRVARLNNFSMYIHCAEQYSKRTLTFDHDSLIAFSGIIRMLESVAQFPVRHIWGVPFFHPKDDDTTDDQMNHMSQLLPRLESPALINNNSLKAPSPNSETGFDYLAFLMLGLCWRHLPSEKPPRRRHDLPSWSWTGWEGALAWPKLSKDSDIRSSTWAETSISLAADSSESVPKEYHNSTDAHLLAETNKSLLIRTSAVSPEAFIFHKPSSSLALTTGGKVTLYSSKSELDASKVFKRIQSARYEVIRLATVDGDAYMMLIKRYRNAYYRIGTMVVEDLYLTYSLFTSEIKTFKLR